MNQVSRSEEVSSTALGEQIGQITNQFDDELQAATNEIKSHIDNGNTATILLLQANITAASLQISEEFTTRLL